MSEQHGKFQIHNMTGTRIRGVAQHRTDDYGKTQLKFEVEKGTTSTQSDAFKTSTSNRDYWVIEFKDMATGRLYVGANKCGFRPEDDGGTVTLKVTQDTFYQIMPVSSNCDTDLD